LFSPVMYHKLLFLSLLVGLATSQVCGTGNPACISYQQTTPVPHSDRVCCNASVPSVLSTTCTCGTSDPCNYCDLPVDITTRVVNYIPASGAICYFMGDNFCQTGVLRNVTFANNATACQSQPMLPYALNLATNYVVQCSGSYINIQACQSDGCPVCSDVFPVPQGYCNANNDIWGPSFVCYCAGFTGNASNNGWPSTATALRPIGPQSSSDGLATVESPTILALLFLAGITFTVLYFFD